MTQPLDTTINSGKGVQFVDDNLIYVKSNQKMDIYDPKTHIIIPRPSEVIKKGIIPNTVDVKSDKTSLNLLYQIVYPDDLNLKPASGALKPRGRPKKTKPIVQSPPSSQKTKIKVVSRTRSGRAIKFPKYIENEFKKIEINDEQITNSNEDVKVSDFVQYTDKVVEGVEKEQEVTHTVLQQKKRKISAQYRCPKCKKAYLGKNKILEHLKKNPTHGPLQEGEEKHFEVWNYLVNVTQKSAASERGRKFCQEISNLLHNLSLLANALFKKLGNVTNQVQIDKVLGNAIGLTPGNYYFDDSNLYRDVTVLQLITNNDFLSSLKFNNDEDKPKSENRTETTCNCGKSKKEADVFKPKSETAGDIPGTVTEQKISQNSSLQLETYNNEQNASKDKDNKIPFFDSSQHNFSIDKSFQNNDLYSVNINNSESSDFTPRDFEIGSMFHSLNAMNICEGLDQKPISKPPKIKIQSDILICPANSKFTKNSYDKITESDHNKDTVNPDILSENSVLVSMQNIPHTADEFMLPVPTESSNILDNSSSSDEVMNVDQFVNERFKKITEPDIEVSNNSLSIDIANLDLFQFHTS
ncbi:hypothetical protein GWI33_013092 [Rhynchophorus ferrugineus]|uniref:C2H2-type domain-containing protein n=1 Tax=Rhynchophorus ferrugineus TaxID=354439 RepID=A0A834MAA8_RHYFE|nr:hypothetical protein GWI33_013092 [Rhynchophorus ferrugineus]